MTKRVAGIDVGKQELAVSVARGPVRGFPNTSAGLTAVLAWVRGQAVTHVVCEATGGYERGLVQRIRGTDLAVTVAHPPKVRAFARAVGQGAKTDPLDAQILAHYGEVFELPVETAQEEASAEVRALLGRRQQLLDQRTQEQNRLEKGVQGRVQEVVSAASGVVRQRAGAARGGVPASPPSQTRVGRTRGLVSECAGSGAAHGRDLAGVCAGIGAGLREGADRLGGAGPVGGGQWDPPGLSGDSRRPGAGAPGVIHGGVVGDPHGHGPGAVVPGVTGDGGSRGRWPWSR